MTEANWALPLKVYVVCVDPERGRYMAYCGSQRAFDFNEGGSICALLASMGVIKIEAVKAES